MKIAYKKAQYSADKGLSIEEKPKKILNRGAISIETGKPVETYIDNNDEAINRYYNDHSQVYVPGQGFISRTAANEFYTEQRKREEAEGLSRRNSAHSSNDYQSNARSSYGDRRTRAQTPEYQQAENTAKDYYYQKIAEFENARRIALDVSSKPGGMRDAALRTMQQVGEELKEAESNYRRYSNPSQVQKYLDNTPMNQLAAQQRSDAAAAKPFYVDGMGLVTAEEAKNALQENREVHYLGSGAWGADAGSAELVSVLDRLNEQNKQNKESAHRQQMQDAYAQTGREFRGQTSRLDMTGGLEEDLEKAKTAQYNQSSDNRALQYEKEALENDRSAEYLSKSAVELANERKYTAGSGSGREIAANAAANSSDSGYASLNDTERRTILSLAAQGRWNDVEDYYNAIDARVNARVHQRRTENIQNASKAAQVGAGLSATLSAPAAFAQQLGAEVRNALSDNYRPIDINEGPTSYLRLAQTGQQESLKDLPEWAKFLGNAGYSIAQNAAVLPLGPAGAAIWLGASAAGQSSTEALENGSTLGQALLKGSASGLIESATEKLGLDNLFKVAKSAGKTGLKSFVGSVLKQAGTEGAEEAISEFANTLFDIVQMGEDSAYEQRYRELVASGMAESQARAATNAEFFIKNPALAAAAGAVSGLLMGGGSAGIQQYHSGKTNRELASNSTALLNAAMNLTKKDGTIKRESDAFQIADQISRDQRYGKKIDNNRYYELAQALEAEGVSVDAAVAAETARQQEAEAARAAEAEEQAKKDRARAAQRSSYEQTGASIFRTVAEEEGLNVQDSPAVNAALADVVEDVMGSDKVNDPAVLSTLTRAANTIENAYMQALSAEYGGNANVTDDGMNSVRRELTGTPISISRSLEQSAPELYERALSVLNVQDGAQSVSMAYSRLQDQTPEAYTAETEAEQLRQMVDIAQSQGQSVELSGLSDSDRVAIEGLANDYAAAVIERAISYAKSPEALQMTVSASTNTVSAPVPNASQSSSQPVRRAKLYTSQKYSDQDIMRNVVDSAAASGVHANVALSISNVAGEMHVKTEFQRLGADSGVNGFYDKATGTIVINADVLSGEDYQSATKAAFIIYGHELVHHLESTGYYAQLKKVVLQSGEVKRQLAQWSERVGRRATFTDLIKMQQRESSKSGQNISLEQAERDYIAQFVAENYLGNPQQLQKVARMNRSLAQQILDWMKKVLRNIKGLHPGHTELEQAHAVLALALDERYTQSDNGEGVQYSFSQQRIPSYEQLMAKPDIPVVDVRGYETGDVKTHRNNIKQDAKNLDIFVEPVRNRDTNELVFITPASLTHTLSNFGRDNLGAAKNIRALVENAVLTHAEASTHGNENTTGVYTLFAAARTANGIQPVKIKVKEYSVSGTQVPKNIQEYFNRNGSSDLYASAYDSRVLEIESIETTKAPIRPIGQTDAMVSGSAEISAEAIPSRNSSSSRTTENGSGQLTRNEDRSAISIRELASLVNDEYQKYLPNKDHSANGQTSLSVNFGVSSQAELLNRYLDEYGPMLRGERVQHMDGSGRESGTWQAPARTSDSTYTRKSVQTFANAPALSPADRKIAMEMADTVGQYVRVGNRETVQQAREKRAQYSTFDQAVGAFLSEAKDARIKDARVLVAMGQQLLMESANEQHNKQATWDIMASLEELLTQLGQGVQAASIINRLSPEGRLVRVRRIVNEAIKRQTDYLKKTEKKENGRAADEAAEAAEANEAAARDIRKVADDIRRGASDEEISRQIEAIKKALQERIQSSGEQGTTGNAAETLRKLEDLQKQREAELNKLADGNKKTGEEIKAIRAKINELNNELKKAKSQAGSTARQYKDLIDKLNGVQADKSSGRYKKAVEAFDLAKQSVKDAKAFAKYAQDNFIQPPTELMERLANAKTVEEQKKIEDQIVLFMAEQTRGTAVEKANSWRYLSMLGNLKTHERNFFSTAASFGASRFKDMVAVGAEKVLIRDKSKKTKAMVTAADRDLLAEADRIFQERADDISGNRRESLASRIQDNRKIWGNNDESKPLGRALNAIERPVGKLSDWNSSAMEWEDRLFLKFSFRTSYAGLLKARGWTPSTMTEQQKAEAFEYAKRQAQDVTFHTPSAFADWVSRGRNKLGAGAFFLDAVVPFTKTPANVLKAGIEYSPLGLFKTGIKALRKAYDGDIAGFAEDLSKNFTGLALAGLGMVFAHAGIIVASGDDDDPDRKNAMDKVGGFQSYSLVLGDMSFSLDWLTPFIMPMMEGVELYNAIWGESEGDRSAGVLTRALDVLTTSVNPLFETSMLDGIASAFQSYSSGGKLAWDVIHSILESYASQFIPTTFGQLARTIDPIKRSTYSSKDSAWTKSLEQTARRLASKVPGISFLLEPVIDRAGQETPQISANALVRAFAQFISPGNVAFDERTGVDNELLRLYDALGETDVLPKTMQSSVTYNGETYSFSPAEYTAYAARRGSITYSELESLMASPEYAEMSDEERHDAVADIIDRGDKEAKAAFLDERGIFNFVKQSTNLEKVQHILEQDWTVERKFEEFTAIMNEKRNEQIKSLLSDGWTQDDIMQGFVKYSELDKTEGLKPSAARAELANFMAERAQKNLMRASEVTKFLDVFNVGTYMPAQAGSYEKLYAAGLSSSAAKKVSDKLLALKPLDGAEDVSTAQRLQAIVSSGISAGEQWEVMEAYYATSEPRLNDIAAYKAAGASAAAYAKMYEAKTKIDKEAEAHKDDDSYEGKTYHYYKLIAETAANEAEAEAAYKSFIGDTEGEREKLKPLEEAGIPYSKIVEYRYKTALLTADKDASGKSISGSKKDKVLREINALSVSAAQKDALYIFAGYSTKDLNKAPWH